MHEYSIVQALLAQVEEAARSRGATAVHSLRLQIGELSGIEIDLFTTAFETFRERSLCANAQLEIDAVAAEWNCPRCRQTLARGSVLRCPLCETPAQLTRGDEILLDRIEMEVANV